MTRDVMIRQEPLLSNRIIITVTYTPGWFLKLFNKQPFRISYIRFRGEWCGMNGAPDEWKNVNSITAHNLDQDWIEYVKKRFR